MKYSVQNYAEAFVATYTDMDPAGRVDIAKRFVALLEKSGDEVHAQKIIIAIEHLLRKKNGGHDVIIESARQMTEENLQKLKSTFSGPKDAVAVRINSNLVAGVRVTVDGEREFDGSLKRKLDIMLGSA